MAKLAKAMLSGTTLLLISIAMATPIVMTPAAESITTTPSLGVRLIADTPASLAANILPRQLLVDQACPEYEGQFFHDPQDNPYTVYCNKSIVSSSWVDAELSTSNINDCLAKCDAFPGCIGVSQMSDQCLLATGTYVGVTAEPGCTAFVWGPAASSLLSINPGIGAAKRDAMPLASPMPMSAPPDLATREAPPVVDDICPQQDGQQLYDIHGQCYTVVCDFIVSSDSQVVETIRATAEQCAGLCTTTTDCVGAVTDRYGKCSVSTGTLAGVIAAPGSIALIQPAVLQNLTGVSKRSSDIEPVHSSESGNRIGGEPCVVARTEEKNEASSETSITPRQPNNCPDAANQKCHESQWSCTWSGSYVQHATQLDAAYAFCMKNLGNTVGTWTWWNETFTVLQGPDKGASLFLGIHNVGTQGWYINMNDCLWDFAGVVDDCDGQGGYVWLYKRGLTFAIGVDGNLPAQIYDR